MELKPTEMLCPTICILLVQAGVVVYKWWKGDRDPHGALLSGKPNVWARKV